MDFHYIKQHGNFALTMVNDIVLVNAEGPWNTECVDHFGLTYAGTVYQSGQVKWADIVVLKGESLLVPDAEAALRKRIERAVGAGLAQIFIVTGDSLVAATSMRQLRTLYEDLPVKFEFVKQLNDAIEGCSASGFQADPSAIHHFFGNPV